MLVLLVAAISAFFDEERNLYKPESREKTLEALQMAASGDFEIFVAPLDYELSKAVPWTATVHIEQEAWDSMNAERRQRWGDRMASQLKFETYLPRDIELVIDHTQVAELSRGWAGNGWTFERRKF